MTTPPVPPPGDGPAGIPPQGGYPSDPQGYYPPPPPGYYPHPAQFGYQPVLPPHAYTSWITRVAAYFIDVVPIVVLVIAGQAIPMATSQVRECIPEMTDRTDGLVCSVSTPLGNVLMAVCSLAALVFGIWNYGYRQGRTGSSIGKSVMKFTVVGEASGRPIGFGLSLVRQLAHIVDGLICNIGYLFPLWDPKRQTLADKIMSTVCLPTPHHN